jgi:protein ImuB
VLGRLPRAGLKKRCGTALLVALDRATGVVPEVYE